MKKTNENEQRYFDALKRIAEYSSVAGLRRDAEPSYGLSFEETLEYAYENIKAEAERAVRGRRRPTVKPSGDRPQKRDAPTNGLVANPKAESNQNGSPEDAGG